MDWADCVFAYLKRAKHGAHVARGVVVDHGKDDGVHERNHVLGAVGRDAQQHVGAQYVEEKNEIEQTGNVEHGLRDGGFIVSSNKKKLLLNVLILV